MGPLKQDLRFALRTLTRSPLFTGVAVLSLALGIGVNTALFSFVDRLLIRSLPIKDPEAVTLLDSPGPRSCRADCTSCVLPEPTARRHSSSSAHSSLIPTRASGLKMRKGPHPAGCGPFRVS